MSLSIDNIKKHYSEILDCKDSMDVDEKNDCDINENNNSSVTIDKTSSSIDNIKKYYSELLDCKDNTDIDEKDDCSIDEDSDGSDMIDKIFVLFLKKYPHLKGKKNREVIYNLCKIVHDIYPNQENLKFYVNFIASAIINIEKDYANII